MRLAFDNGTVYVPGKYHPGLYGLGQDTTDTSSWDSGLGQSDPNSSLMNFAQTLPSAAMSGAATANMLGGSVKADIVGGAQAGLMAAAPFTGPAAPFVLAAASLIAPIASMFKGCGATCTQASQIANQATAAAQSIMDRWAAAPVKYASIQKAALAALNDVWNYIAGSCQKIGGKGGSQCIADRQRGGKYDFFAWAIDPIANYQPIVPDPPTPGTLSSALSGSSLPIPLILGGAGLVVFLLMSGGDSK